ncbi:MAG TPA: beta-galactosidase [Candidatus Mediterraneibacter cottocaccae]|nr:beta-galactosidase [Candidatus Mediterraneibacter cottocaccae]
MKNMPYRAAESGLIHGCDYNPEQWLDRPDILEKDIEMMKEAGINEVTMGVFSWSVLEPEEGKYHLDWLEERMNRLYESGISTILATPSGARPAWLDRTYPEVLRVDEYGRRRHHGVRHNHCISSPAYREKVRQIDTMLAERLGKHPGLLMWHISNELGGECYCEKCAERFREYLRNKFGGDIKRLNDAWWTTFWSHTYHDFDEIEPPYANGERSIMGLNLEWKRFTTWNMNDYMKCEIEVLRRITPDIPVTTNFMKLYQGLDYRVLSRELDVISWDSYPRYHNDYESLYDTCMENAFDHAVMRGMKRERPFLLMESVPGAVNWHEYNKQKRPGMHKLAALQAVACGSDSVQYFQWRKSRGSFEQFHGAVVDHLGSNETRIFRETAETGRILKRIGEIAGSLVSAKAAVLFDWDNRWAIDDMKGLSQQKKEYEKTCLSFYRALSELGIETDVISREDELENYAVVAAPMLYLLGTDTSGKFRKYVENGGKLVCTYLTGYVDRNTLCYLGGFPGDGLTELFGLYSEEIDTLYPSETNSITFSDGSVGKVSDFAEVLIVQDAEVMAVYDRDYYSGMPAVARKQNGKGNAWYIGTRTDRDTLKKIIKMVCAGSGIAIKELPPEVEFHSRYNEKYEYQFYFNYGESDAVIWDCRGFNLLTGESVSSYIRLKPGEQALIRSEKFRTGR